jgi:formylglycine-generating enzyme required for sulfatase activity
MLPRGDDEPELLAWLATITRRPWFAPAAGTAIVALLGLGAVLLLVFANSGQDEQKPPQRLAAKSQQDAGPAAEAKHPGMAYVPSGNVVLGADEGRLRSHARSLASISDNADAENLVEQFVDLCDDTPHRTVAVQGFWIDRNEVTNADYAKFITATGHPTPPHWIERRPPAGLENHPVTQVSYDDAQAYAKWAGKLLPTEAQWVRAYRGDSEYMYPWGNLWESGRAATFPDITDDTSRPVDAFPQDRTAQGVLDMEGNVCEMLRDRTRLDGVPVAVIKGADYGSNGDIYSAAPACRRVAVDDDQQPGIGFRCVIEESR